MKLIPIFPFAYYYVPCFIQDYANTTGWLFLKQSEPGSWSIFYLLKFDLDHLDTKNIRLCPDC